MTAEKEQKTFSFVEMEHEILDFWDQESIFQQSLKNTKDKKPYIFYDGPPFATGLPHHGHLVASTIKDVVPRYWTMKGRYVMRRFGWDCHGLPVEHEIDKKLGISAQDAINSLGVRGYNDECRAIVQRYVSEWRQTITRIGRWVDFENDYKTMDTWFMESVWWAFKQLWDKGLIYQGMKVVPVSTELGTPLANFEATSNYKDVQDPAITVLLKIIDREEYLAVWTTTPWTLPSNLAVCVGANIDYCLVEDPDTGLKFYLAEERISAYEDKGRFTILGSMKGDRLVGLSYEPPFDYFLGERERGAFVVLSDDYVTTDSGTGLVHQAPAFGEEDYRVLNENGIEAFVCPVGLDGCFTSEVFDLEGQHVKDADKQIITTLKDHGKLFRQEVIQHSYPYCYRSDTPLIYRAIPSWYVAVTNIKENLLNANQKISWVPGHIKNGRFGNFLDGAIDWAISRNRVWGTPIPVWQNDLTGEFVCIGSIEELAKKTGVTLNDLHRENVDPLTFEIDGEEGTYRRIEEVLDCWFESGSMPYAQLHYPFENEGVFESGFPAEFIAEGLDQTRGWFYTLTVLAAGLFDQPAFRNVIVNGLVMAQDGKKMSKSLRNYTPPDDLMEEFGADALRLYSINSGLVKGEELRFSDSGVKEMVRRALLPWYNAFSFLKTYSEIDDWSPDKGVHVGSNILDLWIGSRLQTLKSRISEEMEGYRLYNVVPNLFNFIEDLTNWYIRLNRSRFWASDVDADKIAAFSTLYEALIELSKIMAPFAPFLSEHLYRSLFALGGGKAQPISVHLCDYPIADSSKANSDLEGSVTLMQQVVLLGRQKREEEKIGLRTPLSTLTIIHQDKALLQIMESLEVYLKDELNVRTVKYSSDEEHYLQVKTKANYQLLGKELGSRMKGFADLIGALSNEQVSLFQNNGSITLSLDGFSRSFTGEEILLVREPREGSDAISNGSVSIELDCALTPELIRGGYAREVVNRIQRARKEAGLEVSDRIEIAYIADPEISLAIEEHKAHIETETLAVELEPFDGTAAAIQADIDTYTFSFQLSKVER